MISPALGGIIVGQEIGRSLGKRHIFVEKEDGKLVLRRGFQISPDEKFVVVEDVVTRGGRVQETIDIVREPWRSRFCCWRDCRSKWSTRNRTSAVRSSALVEMSVENFPADNLPPDLAKIPAVKPGSK